jgi:hypothetical protein
MNQGYYVNNPVAGSKHGPFLAMDEAALLITCLRGLPFTVPQDMNWNSLLVLAEENGVLLLLYQALIEKDIPMPDSFIAAAVVSRTFAQRMAGELEELLQQFAEQQIDVLPLKGPLLAMTIYGSEILRLCNDLDLLVCSEEYIRAKALLLSMGFVACEADDYHCRFQRGEIPVELHFSIAKPKYFPFDMDSIWRRSSLKVFRGRPVRAMSEDDLILYLCSHGLKHGFSRMIWILDVAMALQHLSLYSYEEIVQRACEQEMEPWLFVGCEVVRSMFPQLLPVAMDAVISARPAAASRAREVAARLFTQETSDVINDYRVFYLQAQPSALKRLRYRLRYLAPTTEDYRWADRHRIKREFMILVRPIRLLQKYGVSMVLRILFPPQT